MTIIEQLKQNEKPFNRMSKEMQAMAKTLPWECFVVWGYVGNDDKWIMPASDSFQRLGVYRLLDDYKEEPEIVECEIEEDGLGKFHYNRLDGITSCGLSTAVNYSDFIGFKFEDGGILQYPVRYITPATKFTVNCPSLDTLDAYDIWHATHVLFRRPK